MVDKPWSDIMMAYKLKRFPAPLDAPALAAVTQSCAFILTANWLMQGVRGMDRKELAFRLLLEAVLAAAMLSALARVGVGGPAASALALAVAHSLNFTLNGQVWVCARYCRRYRRNPAAVAVFLVDAKRLLQRQTWLDEAALIGSRGRAGKQWGPRSDIDLRLVVPPGPSGWLRANLLLLRLRSRAFVRAIPLDLYAYDSPASLARLDQAEPLLPILDRRGRLAAAFPDRIAR
jgi:hypothetical protein